MRETFAAEMRLLQEAAQEFALAFPEQAGMLNLQEVRDRDPYVERLLEGMAFLSAQVRRRLDDDVPELCEALLEQLWPQAQRPFPSACIVQFVPRPGQLQQGRELPRDTVLMSPPVGDEKVICRFRTTSPVKLLPLRLSRVAATESAGGYRLGLTFQIDAGLRGEDLDLQHLPLYLQAEPLTALKLHHDLTRAVQGVRVRFPDQPTVSPQVLGGQEALQPAHFATEELLVPAAGRSLRGFHLLLDYFAFREKYLFVHLRQLERIDWPPHCATFEIEIDLAAEPLTTALKKENLRLFCAPAINLFAATSEPIDLTHRRSEYPVVADATCRDGVEIFSLDAVTGSAADGGRRPYPPLHSFRHLSGGRYFRTARRTAGERRRLALMVGGDLDFARETLSCSITACNGDYPRRHLPENALQVPSPDFPPAIRFGNLTRPSRLLRPPQVENLPLVLISHLCLSLETLSSLETFRGMLTLFDWSGQEQNRRRLEGLQQLEVRPVDRLHRGGLMRGLRILLQVREESFLSPADIQLFGLVLHHFFGMYAMVNTFIETRLVCHPSGREFTWKPVLGENLPL